MNKPLAQMARTVLDAKTIGQESAAVNALLVELQIQGHIVNRHDWCFEAESREHEIVHLWSDATGRVAWLEINPETGEVTKL